jgi:hypothetical protein
MAITEPLDDLGERGMKIHSTSLISRDVGNRTAARITRLSAQPQLPGLARPFRRPTEVIV